MNLGKRIEVAFRLAGTSAPAVSKAAKVPVASINALLRRDSKRSGYVDRIVSVLPPDKVNIDWVITGVGGPEPAKHGAHTEETDTTPTLAPAIARAAHIGGTVKSVPLQAWEHQKELPPGDWAFLPRLVCIPAPGEGMGIKTVFLLQEVQVFRTDWIRADQLQPDRIGWSVAADEAMAPVICQGDLYVIDTGHKKIIDGKTFAVWYGDQLRPRKLFMTPNGKVRVSANNHDFESFDIDPAELIIVGLIVRKAGSGGL